MSRATKSLAILLSEIARIAVIIFILHALMRRWQEARDHRAVLIARMGSQVKSVALEAAQAVREAGWLVDGSLREANFTHAWLSGAVLDHADLRRASFLEARLRGAIFAWADLRGATLREANLEGASLFLANLEGASVSRSNLRGAVLRGAYMSHADLRYANLFQAELCRADLRDALLKATFFRQAKLHQADLRNAHLERADLQGADLRGAQLGGASLHGAELQGALLGDAVFDASTVLPDGTSWTPETDLARFTDPAHPTFYTYRRPPDWAGIVLEQQRALHFEQYEQEIKNPPA